MGFDCHYTIFSYQIRIHKSRHKHHRLPNLRSIALNLTEIRSLKLGTERRTTHLSPAPHKAGIQGRGRACTLPTCPDRDLIACQISAPQPFVSPRYDTLFSPHFFASFSPLTSLLPCG